MGLELHQNPENLEATGDSHSSNSPSRWAQFCNVFHPRPREDDDPQDWWFASTAIPLIAATTAPFANVMSIVALAMPCRSTFHFDETTKDGLPLQVLYDDPTWSLTLNATSLACGVAGNVFLLCNFTQAVRYIIALPCSIILWYMAMALLIGITSAMHIYVPPAFPHEAYTQAYWFAVIAAALYFILATILTINLLGYLLGHYAQDFILTDSQRTLILQTTALGVWLIVGAAIFQRLMGLSLADALYFVDITILTLGFGDVTATTPVARGIIFPYAVIGIIMLGLVIGSLNRAFHEVQYQNVIRKRMEERRQAVVARSTAIGNANNLHSCNNDTKPETEQVAAPQSHGNRSLIARVRSRLRHRVVGNSPVISVQTERDRFNAMRTIQRDTVRFQRWYRLTLSLIAFALVWTCGAAVFCTLEDELTYFSALYFNFVCLLSVGYGDITPTTNAGRSFFVLWSLMAVPTMTTLISEMSDTIIAAFQRLTNLFAKCTFLPQFRRDQHSRETPPRALRVSFPPILNFLQIGQDRGPMSQRPQPQDIDAESANNDLMAAPKQIWASEDSSGFDLSRKLVSAIGRVGDDVIRGEPEQYSYEEWIEFSQLISATHPPQHTMVPGGKDEYGVLNCDWIGENSPMLSSQTEPQWVLERLCEGLRRYTDVLASQYSGRDKGSSHLDNECSSKEGDCCKPGR